MARKRKLDWAALNARIPVRWCPDPHRRGQFVPNKKLYQRKPRTPSGVCRFKYPRDFQLRAA